MSTRILPVTVLLLAVCLCFQVSAANRWHPNKAIPLCCTKVSPAPISERITGNVTIQKASRPCVKALIFPVKGKKLCVDPEADWAQTFLDKNKKP